MRYKAAALLGLISFQAEANVIQYLTGISYSNPADLFKVKQNEFIIGATGFRTVGRFTGSALNFNTGMYDYGTAYTKTTSLLPYGRIAGRYNQNLVLGVDVTEPFHSNLDWGNDSFTRYAATQNLLTDIDISPRGSYAFSKSFILGGGFNFNFLKNNEPNWALPSGRTTYANLVNRTSGFGIGFNLGLDYNFNQSNFLGLAYYSTISQKTRGSSFFNENANNQLVFNFRMPATTVVNYTHLFNESWLANAEVLISEWTANQYVNFYNTSAPPPINKNFHFKMLFKPAVAWIGVVRHQLTPKFGITALGMVDNGPERENYRTLNFPSDDQYFLALVGDYQTTKTSKIELLFGYGFAKTIMNNYVIIAERGYPFTTGKVHLSAPVVDLKYKVQM